MVQAPRRRRRFAWFLCAAACGAGVLWALAPGRGGKGSNQQSDEAQATADERELGHLQRAIEVLTRAGTEPASLEARRAALADLVAEAEPAAKLHVLLAAVAADPTPPEQDP